MKMNLGSFRLWKNKFSEGYCSCLSCAVHGADATCRKRHARLRSSRSRNLWHPADDSFDRTATKAFRRIRNKVTSAVFRAGSSWESATLVCNKLINQLSKRLPVRYFFHFVFNHGGPRLQKKVFESTIKVLFFFFLLLLAADWCWVSAGRVEEFSDLLSRKSAAKLCCSFL